MEILFFLPIINRNTGMKTLRLQVLTLCIMLCSQTSYSQNFDVNTLASIENTRTPFLNHAMEGISFSAYIMAPAVPIGILSIGLATANHDAAIGGLQIGAGILLSTATTFAIKKLFQRPRPYDSHPDRLHPLAHEHSYSFPSGHTSVAFATATSLSLQFQKWYITVPAFLWAATVGYSRMYLGVHYPSDVLIGIVVGMTTAYLSYKVQQWIKPQVQIPITIRL